MPPLKQRRLQIDRSRSKRRGSEDGKLSDFGFKKQKQQQDEEHQLTSDDDSVRDDDGEEDQRVSDEHSFLEEDNSVISVEAEASKPQASNANRGRRSSTKAVKATTKRTKRNNSKKSAPSYKEKYNDEDDFEPYFQESESDNDDDDEDFEQIQSKRVTRTSSPARRSTRASSGRMTQKSILETIFFQKPTEPHRKKRATTTNTAARRSKQQTINFGPNKLAAKKDDSDSDIGIARKKPSPASSRSRSVKSATKGTARKRIQKLEEDESSEEEEEAVGQTDESSEEEIAVVSQKRAGAKRRPRRAAAAKKSVVEHEDSYDDDSAQEVVTKSTSRATKASNPARTPTVKRASRQRKIMVDSDESEENLEEEEEESPNWRNNATRSSRKSARVASNSTADIDDASEASNAGGSNRPSRMSATRAAEKLSQLSNQNDSDLDAAPNKKPGFNTEISSDEEFLDDDHSVDHHSTDSSDGSEGNFEHADESEVLSLIKNGNDGQLKNVDDEEVGSMDESSNDRDGDNSENELEVLPPQPRRAGQKRSKSSPPLEVVTYQRKKSRVGDGEIQPRKHRDKGDESEFSDSDSEQSADGEVKKQNRSNSRSNARPKLPPCPSTHDTITAEPLPRRHVCFIPPDGKSRQCFALETLRKISLTCTGLVQSMSNGPVWLQPPHFRTELSDDMQDQIASRFGREALEIHGTFYNRDRDNLVARLRNGSGRRQEFDDEHDDDDDDDAFIPSETLNDETFQDRLQKYMDNQMGGQDVYCCPLCYSEMHSRTANNSIAKQLKRQARAARQNDGSGSEEGGNNSDNEDDEERVEESIYDPMHVLQIVNDDYQVAGAVCNTKVANVKRHMREDHRVETKDVQGNDLYARFKIRTQDGLLQRWLKKKSRFGTFQGDMRKYWNEGNNQNFLLLLARIQEAEAHKQTLKVSSGDELEEERQIALEYLAPSMSFFHSMQARAKQNWKQISAPFQKARIDDMKDFIIQGSKDEESDGADEVPHYALRRELDAQNAASSDEDDPLMRKLRKYTDAPQEYDDGGFEFNEEEGISSDGGGTGVPKYELSKEDLNPRGYYSEEEEETDEWVKKRLVSNKRQSRSNKAAGPSTKKVLRKRKPSITSAASGSTSQVPIVKVAPTPPSKRRQIMVDSDEE